MGEALRIRNRRREGAISNARGEYNRCSITRLTLGEETKEGGQNRLQNITVEGEGEQADDWLNREG